MTAIIPPRQLDLESAEDRLPRLFYGPPALASALANYDVREGDRLYDDPSAYFAPWSEALKRVTASLLVKSASRGELGYVTFIVSHWNGTEWRATPPQQVTQAEFRKFVKLAAT